MSFGYNDILPVVQDVLQTSAEIGEDARLTDVGLDSVLTVNLFVAIEERLQITFRDEDLVGDNFQTIRHVLEIANRAWSAASASA